MRYVSSLSGGVASAVAHYRAVQRYGKENVLPWFADTLWEDEDLYRFLADFEAFIGQKIYRHTEGRTPLEVAEAQHIIPNSRIAPCSLVLKQRPFKRFIENYPKPVTVLLGLDWSEQHRMDAPRRVYEAIPGVSVDFPLMWKPYDYDIFQTVRNWGIEIPRLYRLGFPHNNCGGRCVRQGVREWRRLRNFFPARFEEVAVWETHQRAQGDARKDFAICRVQSGGVVRPLPLPEIEAREIRQGALQEDLFSCFCTY